MRTRIDGKLLSIFLLALLLRVALGIAVREPVDRGDMARYESLAIEGGLSTQQEPLYPLLLRLIYRLFGVHDHRAIFTIQGFMSAIVVLLAYSFTLGMFDRKAALIAALLCAVYPNFILYNLTVLPETALILMTASIAAVAASGMRDASKACIGGAVTGVGILTSASFAFFVPGLLIVLKRRLLFLLALAITVAPWIARNAVVYGKLAPIYDTSSFNIGVAQYSRGWMGDIESVYSRTAALYQWHWGESSLKQDGGTRTIPVFAIRKFSFLAILLFGCIAIARYIRREHLRVILPALIFVALQIMIAMVYTIRYRALLEIFLIAYIGFLLSRTRGAADAA
ncbi:MAG: glycosyltransferase family 39 protein [Candidatus Krumholzibacteria bacterium]|nr:glycosyltransferase family 39 protein [Candidatus Krumholzibacteria bacterium]